MHPDAVSSNRPFLTQRHFSKHKHKLSHTVHHPQTSTTRFAQLLQRNNLDSTTHRVTHTSSHNQTSGCLSRTRPSTRSPSSIRRYVYTHTSSLVAVPNSFIVAALPATCLDLHGITFPLSFHSSHSSLSSCLSLGTRYQLPHLRVLAVGLDASLAPV